jgi:hypothetical protein
MEAPPPPPPSAGWLLLRAWTLLGWGLRYMMAGSIVTEGVFGRCYDCLVQLYSIQSDWLRNSCRTVTRIEVVTGRLGLVCVRFSVPLLGGIFIAVP